MNSVYQLPAIPRLPNPVDPPLCRQCGAEPALLADPLASGLCWPHYCQMRDETAAAWQEYESLSEAAEAERDAHLQAEWLRHFGAEVA